MAHQANSPSIDPGASPVRISRWLKLRPSPLAAAFTGFVILVMVGLAAFIIDEYRSLQLQFHGKVGSVYIDNLLAPIALSFHNGVAEVDPATENVFRKLTEDNSRLVLRIWNLDRTLVYSTFAADTAAEHDAKELDTALSGRFVSKLKTSDVVLADFPMTLPYFEVYVPIHSPITGEMVAVGEIYQDASEILRDRAFVERTVWVATALATLGVLAMLALTFSQSARLEDRLKLEKWMTRQNDQLRRKAVQARLDNAQANEQVLNFVGAELHDGPIQTLGLMSLMRNGGAYNELADGTTLDSLGDQVMTELRTISAGLILPELKDLDAIGVIELAVGRHRDLSGGKVDIDIDQIPFDLDTPRRVCLYRVLQEGLANAARHGEGKTPQIMIRTLDTALEIQIRNCPHNSSQAVPDTPALRLGLQGMRRRLEVFGGTLAIHNSETETTLTVSLPMLSEAASPG